jgi:glucose dehydrogenase
MKKTLQTEETMTSATNCQKRMHAGFTLSLLACMLSSFAGRALAQKAAVQSSAAQDHTTWRDYGGSADSAQYSALHQINRSNVKKLQVAWSYPTGDDNRYVFNPIVVDGTMYVLAKHNSIVALDAATGKELWAHATDPKTTLITNRGINYWESADRSDRRLLFSMNNEWPRRPACWPGARSKELDARAVL